MPGNASDSASISEFGIPPRPIQYQTLPPKLQARGDALDSGGVLARNAMGGRQAQVRPSTPTRAATASASAASSRPATLLDVPAAGVPPALRAVDPSAAEVGVVAPEANAALGAAAQPAGAPSKRLRVCDDVAPPDSTTRGSVSSQGSGETTRTGSLSQSRSRNGSSRSGQGRRSSLASSSVNALAAKRPSAPNPYAAASAVAFWNFHGSSDKTAAKTAASAGSSKEKGSSTSGSVKSGASRSTAQPSGGRPGAGPRVQPSGLPGVSSAQRSDGSPYAFGFGSGSSTPYSFPDRKVSVAPTLAGRATGGAAGSAGAWQAPDSWAVKPEGAMSFDDSDSDEEGHGDDDDQAEEDLLEEDGFESDESALVPLSGSNGEIRPFGSLDAEIGFSRAGRPSTGGGGRPGTRNGRPSTADGEGRKGSQKPVSALIVARHDPQGTNAHHSPVYDPRVPRRRHFFNLARPAERQRFRTDDHARAQVSSEHEASLRALHPRKRHRTARRPERKASLAATASVRAGGLHGAGQA